MNNLLLGAAQFVASAFVACASMVFGYPAIRSLWGFRKPPLPQPQFDACFGVLIAAHNEAGAMTRLFESLHGLHYPADRLKVLFIADHCTDATMAEIEAAGFRCLDRRSGPSGKGAAIGDGHRQLRSEFGPVIDAYAVFDADNVIDRDFFAQAAAGLAEGHPVLQGNVGIYNWKATVFSRLNYLNAMVENRLEELARSQAGLSCHLRGHGMVFRASVLERVPWSAHGAVEDQDMLVRLVSAGIRVHWLEHARVRSVLPETARAAKIQRQRWAGGRSEILRRATEVLWKRYRTHRDWVALNLLVDLALPSHAVQLALVAAAIAVSALCGLDSWQFVAATALVPLYLAYFLVGNILAGTPPRAYLTIIWAPFFIAWRTWIYFSSLGGVKRWR